MDFGFEDCGLYCTMTECDTNAHSFLRLRISLSNQVQQQESRQSICVLLFLLAICVGGGALIGIFSANDVDTWYQTLKRPSWTPPNWLFGPAWTTLYLCMAIAMWLVWKQGSQNPGKGKGVQLPVICFAIQLILNFAWTPVFFGARQIGWGMVIIVMLIAAVAITKVVFSQYHRWAGWLMIPYLGWVIFASTLNGGFLVLNGW